MFLQRKCLYDVLTSSFVCVRVHKCTHIHPHTYIYKCVYVPVCVYIKNNCCLGCYGKPQVRKGYQGFNTGNREVGLQ